MIPGPPPLPVHTPPELREFVACRSISVDLRAGRARWLPSPPGVPRRVGRFLAPSLAIEPTSSPATAALAVGWGPLALRFSAEVRDGGLQLVPPRAPVPRLADLVAGFERWAAQLNAWLGANGWHLAPLEVASGRLIVRKVTSAR